MMADGGHIDMSLYPLSVAEGGPELFIPSDLISGSIQQTNAAFERLRDAHYELTFSIGTQFIPAFKALAEAMKLSNDYDLPDTEVEQSEPDVSGCRYCKTKSTRVNLRSQVECSGCGAPR